MIGSEIAGRMGSLGWIFSSLVFSLLLGSLACLWVREFDFDGLTGLFFGLLGLGVRVERGLGVLARFGWVGIFVILLLTQQTIIMFIRAHIMPSITL